MHVRSSRSLKLAGAILAMSTVAACGSGGDDSADEPASPTTVTFWQIRFEDFQQAWFEEQIDAFNASQDEIAVEYTVVPGDVWDAKIKAAQAAGTTPDVVTTAYGAIRPGVANGQFARLDDLMPAKALADIQPSIVDLVRTGDGHYGYPMLVEPSNVLYYRTDLFEGAGLDPEEPPATWDELIAAARALTQDGTYGMNVAQTAPDLSWSTWGLQYNAAGHLPISDDWSSPAVLDDGYRQLAELYRALYAERLMPPEATVPHADITPYGEGKVAMSAGGSWALATLAADYPEILATTGVAAFPSIDGDRTKPTATLGGWSLTVDAKSDVKQESADFIAWLLAGDPASLVDFFKASSYSKYPARTSVAQALVDDPDASASPFVGIITSDIIAHAKPEPAYPFDVSLAFGTALEKIMKGEDMDAAFAEAETAIADVIEQQRLAGTAQ